MKSKHREIIAGHIGNGLETAHFFQSEEPAYVPCRFVSLCRKSCPENDSNCRIKRFYDKYASNYTIQARQCFGQATF